MWTVLLCIAGGLAAAYFLFGKYMKRNDNYWPSKNVYLLDLLKVESFWNRITFKTSLPELERKTYDAFKKAGVKKYGGMIELGKPSLLIMDLDLLRNILVKDFDHFLNRRPSIIPAKSDPMFHKMLTNAENQEWKNLRSTVSPTFTTGKIRRMYQVFSDSSDKLTEFLQNTPLASNEVELRDVFSRYTTDVISSAAFGLDSQVFDRNMESQVSKMAKKFQDQITKPNALKAILLALCPGLFTLLGLKLFEGEPTEFFADVVKKTIKHRLETGEKRDDVLQLLLETRNQKEEEKPDESKMETYEKDAVLHKASKITLTEDLIMSQSLLFFLAGSETTETLLNLAAYELAINQDVQDKLYDEVHEAASKNGGKLNYEAIMQCEYLEKIVSETLRKYPPGFRTERYCLKDYKVPNSDLVIEKNTIIAIPIYGIHMDEDYYPNPHKFDPERFSAENKAARHPYSYLPFGHGPRNCIAMRFALTEAKSCVAHLILNFKLEPSQKTEIPIKNTLTTGFKPKDGLFLKVTSRK